MAIRVTFTRGDDPTLLHETVVDAEWQRWLDEAHELEILDFEETEL